jgi:hypothetical protein
MLDPGVQTRELRWRGGTPLCSLHWNEEILNEVRHLFVFSAFESLHKEVGSPEIN